jgi:hypothetical protein
VSAIECSSISILSVMSETRAMRLLEARAGRDAHLPVLLAEEGRWLCLARPALRESGQLREDELPTCTHRGTRWRGDWRARTHHREPQAGAVHAAHRPGSVPGRVHTAGTHRNGVCLLVDDAVAVTEGLLGVGCVLATQARTLDAAPVGRESPLPAAGQQQRRRRRRAPCGVCSTPASRAEAAHRDPLPRAGGWPCTVARFSLARATAAAAGKCMCGGAHM